MCVCVCVCVCVCAVDKHVSTDDEAVNIFFSPVCVNGSGVKVNGDSFMPGCADVIVAEIARVGIGNAKYRSCKSLLHIAYGDISFR